MPRIILACALLSVVSCLGAADPRHACITILLVNSAQASERSIEQAEAQASHALAEAGIAIVWRNCLREACPTVAGRGEFWMHVALWRPHSTSDGNLGFTLVDATSGTGSGLAGIYYPMAREIAGQFRLPESDVIAAAMAHEIGHLLGAGHARSGVMAPNFDRAQIVRMGQGALRFSAEEASRMTEMFLPATAATALTAADLRIRHDPLPLELRPLKIDQ